MSSLRGLLSFLLHGRPEEETAKIVALEEQLNASELARAIESAKLTKLKAPRTERLLKKVIEEAQL